MAGASVGFFGKLPSNGDFIERRVAERFRDVWDEWLQRCIAASRQTLGPAWLDCYLTSPMWRFFVSDGVAGAASYAGVLLPSVDRVGRYFPLTVVAELPAATAPLAFARGAGAWYAEVERACSAALQSESDTLAELDESLAASAGLLASLDALEASCAFPGSSTHWHWPLRSIDELAPALTVPLSLSAQSALRPLTLWWTEGSERVQPSVLLVRALPRAEAFTAFLDGGWQAHGWDGVAEDSHGAEPLAADWSAPSRYEVQSAAATDVGTVRQQNQDNYALNDENRLWAVADGMGGHSHGEIASQMVVDALNSVEPSATLNAALESIGSALARVNADLRRAALGVGQPARSGSTVVVLVLRGPQWGVSWAGDSRAYVLRAGTLRQLTEDHRPPPHEAEEPAGGFEWLGGSGGEITRAVGGDEALQLDTVVDQVADGDRFLLCSDGLYAALEPEAILGILRDGTPAQVCAALIEAARAAGARDNVTAAVIDVHAQDHGQAGD